MRLPSRLWTLSAALLALSGVAANAADLMPRLNPVGAYPWQGPYVGANLGYQWGTTKPAGITGGVQAGYNMQAGAFVFGVETDIQFSDASDRFAPWKFSNPWFGTLRGRAGYAINNMLLYGTVGLAYGTLRGQNTLTGASQSTADLGWAAGAGLEVGMFGNWTAKAEYLYVDLTDRPYAITGTNNGLESHLLRLGMNFRF
jgi:outer membrane immunogenic protein